MTTNLPPAPPAPGRARPSGSAPLPILLLFATLLIAIVGAWTYKSLRDDIRASAQRTLAVIAEQKKQEIDQWLSQARIDAEIFFSGPSSVPELFRQWQAGGEQDRELLAQLSGRIDLLARAKRWGGVALFDTHGRLAFSQSEAIDPELGAEQIRQVLEDRKPRIIDLHRDRHGHVVFGMLAPITSAGTRPLGVVYLLWLAEHSLYPQVERWPVPTRSAETYLVRAEGEQVLFLSPLRFHPGAALALTRPRAASALPAARAVRGERGLLVGGIDYRGVPVLSYVTPVAGAPWLMIAEINQEEVEAGIRTVAWGTGLVAVLGLLLVYALGYLLWRRDRQKQELAVAELRAEAAVRQRFLDELEQRVAERTAEARAINEQLAAREKRLEFVLEGSRLGTWDWNIATGEVSRNDYWAAMLGYTLREVDDATADSWLALIHPEDRERARQSIDDHLAGKIPLHEVEYRMRGKDGSYNWILDRAQVVQRDEQGRPLRMSGTHESISHRKEAEGQLLRAREEAELANRALQAVNEKLHRLATTDALTGTWNRRHFEECATAAIARAHRYHEPLCLILFDIDHFKSINDRCGHEMGDRVLVEVAHLLGEKLRETEVLARWGGEEFVLLLPHCTAAEGVAAAERLRHLLEERPLPCAERVTASFGIGELRAEEGFPDWLRRVDKAMYAAKATGRNTVCRAE